MESPTSGTEFKGKQPQEYIRMEAVATFVKVSFPRYLARLPVPKTFSGIAKLSGEDWIHLFPFMLTIGFILYAVVRLFHPAVESRKKSRPINDIIKKDSPKVATLVDVEDLDKEKVAYCRCWKSTKFPLCDGTHNAHNEESGDNVGPLVIKKKKL